MVLSACEMVIREKSSTGCESCNVCIKISIIVKKDNYKQKLRGWINKQPPPVSEPRSKTHWTGGRGSFEDKQKRRPPNVLVDNLPRGGWKSDEYDSNSYCDSRGSYLGNTNDHSSASSCRDGYLGQHSDD